MTHLKLSSFLVFLFLTPFCQGITVYCLPGMGTDVRVFTSANLERSGHEIVYLDWQPREADLSLAEYARTYISQIDTTEPFAILGVSMGGMIAVELCRWVRPAQLILVSSAIKREELPFHARVAAVIPAQRLLSESMLQWVSQREHLLQMIYPNQSDLYQDMWLRTGAEGLKWQVEAIAGYDPPPLQVPLYRIHGTRDGVLPLQRMSGVDHTLTGTHKLIVDEADEVCRLVTEVLAEL